MLDDGKCLELFLFWPREVTNAFILTNLVRSTTLLLEDSKNLGFGAATDKVQGSAFVPRVR